MSLYQFYIDQIEFESIKLKSKVNADIGILGCIVGLVFINILEI